jgi:hypothetical protein
MQLDAILEVAIGLVFVWLVISIATLEFQNRITGLLNWRADHLENSILNMFKDPNLMKSFYEHPLIAELAPKDKNGAPIMKKGKPRQTDYVPSATFAKVACEVIMNAGKPGDRVPLDSMSLDQMKEGAKALAQSNPNLAQINQYLLPRMERSVSNIEEKVSEYRRNTENWFNDVMTQASVGYKVRAQRMAFWIGLTIAIFINIDTIHIAQKLWQEPTARAVIVAQAQREVQGPTPPENISFSTARSLNFPAGWTTTALDVNSCRSIDIKDYQLVIRSAGKCLAVTSLPAFNNAWGWIVKVAGYILSAFAAAQGAPFWFDVLKKLVGIKQQPAPAK